MHNVQSGKFCSVSEHLINTTKISSHWSHVHTTEQNIPDAQTQFKNWIFLVHYHQTTFHSDQWNGLVYKLKICKYKHIFKILKMFKHQKNLIFVNVGMST